MTAALRYAFWASAALVGYTYAAFPLLVLARARLWPRPYDVADISPRVSVIIAAHNEQGSIGSRLENLLSVDYPPDALEIVVASDGSTDGTEEIARRYVSERVKLVAPGRVGKAQALQAAVAASSGDILVFTDANTRFDSRAISMLVRPFADRSVGGVAGNQRYERSGKGDAARGERTYWDFDRLIKIAESQAGSTISATGAIYAIRRELFRGVPVGVTDDFAVSTSVIEQGHRLVFEPEAVAWEPAAGSDSAEWDRKVRIMTRGLRGVWMRRQLLKPSAGFYAVQLLTHKVLRRLMALPLLVLLITALSLARAGAAYRLVGMGMSAVLGLGVSGALLRGHRAARHPMLALPSFFVMVNAASLAALWNVIRGKRIDRWRTNR